MSLDRLFDRLGRMPFVKIALLFAAGIALADAFVWPLWFTAGAFVVSGALALLFRSQSAAAVLLTAAGVGAVQLHERPPTAPRGVHTLFELHVDEAVFRRESYTAAEATLAAWRDPASGRWHPSGDRVRLYADSTLALAGGERIRCRGVVRPLAGGERYRRQMARRGVVGSLRLGQRQILGQLPAARGSLHRRAVERIGRLGLGGEADAVVRAMTAGDRSRIPAELREAYARSGLAHLLALSGLHTGILFVAVNAALWWLPLVRYGHRWRNLLAVAAVWTFVAAAGFPASAVRAAAMCTLLQAALATSSEYDGLNALGTAAFGMLLWNPAWLHDVGFRLSVTAVAGILAWGVPLARRLRTGRRWIDAPIASLVVSAAATLATAPLVAHAFGRIPLAGIVVTPAALLPAGAVVACGALWLLLPLPPLAWLLRPAAALSVAALDTLCRTAAAWPGAVVERSLTGRGVALVYLLFALATAAAWCVEPKKSVHLPS